LPDESVIVREQSGVWDIYRLSKASIIAKLERISERRRDVTQRPRAFEDLFPRASSLDVVHQVFVWTIDDLAVMRSLDESITMLKD
jgi:hypothetical protein